MKQIAYSWQYEGHEGMPEVGFELLPSGSGTLLRLTHTGIGTFPENNPDFAIENFEAGWEQILGESLAKYLDV